MVDQPSLRHDDEWETRQYHRLGRYRGRGTKGGKAKRLLRDDHPMVMVIRGDLGNIVPVIGMMMGRQAGAQRHEDEEHDTVYESV